MPGAGGGSVRAIRDAGLSGRVQMLGWLSGDKKFQALSDARLLVVPSTELENPPTLRKKSRRHERA
jgi:glycosyltransferase involved in cell wall biosynthesis